MNYPITASRLRKAMEDSKMMASELEAKSGIGKSSISHYYNGTHKPSNIAAEAIATVLNVNPLWLMGFDVPEDRTMFLYAMLDEADKGRIRERIEMLLEDSKYKKASNKGGKVG